MSTYKPELNLLEPANLNNETGINAWFTLKNGNKVNSSGSIPGLNLGFNTSAEREEVISNRDLLFKTLGLDPDWTAFAEQVHGTRVQFINNGGLYSNTDGLVTRVPGLALGIQVADCGAVLLGDPVLGIVAAVHAGWRGAAGNILLNALQVMKEEGSDPANIKAWISPCISQKNFEVGEEVAEQFPDDFVDRNSYEKPHVDLKAFLKNQMAEQGMEESNIAVDEHCTIEQADTMYSFRRENEQAGRMMGIIQIAD